MCMCVRALGGAKFFPKCNRADANGVKVRNHGEPLFFTSSGTEPTYQLSAAAGIKAAISIVYHFTTCPLIAPPFPHSCSGVLTRYRIAVLVLAMHNYAKPYNRTEGRRKLTK